MLWTKKFWIDLSERVISSAAGGALAASGIDAVTPNVSININHVLLGAAVAAGVSLLKGLIASQVGSKDSASLVE